MADEGLIFSHLESDFSEDLERGCSFLSNGIYVHVIKLQSRESGGLTNKGHECDST